MKSSKRFLALILAVLLVVSVMPVSLGEDGTDAAATWTDLP